MNIADFLPKLSPEDMLKKFFISKQAVDECKKEIKEKLDEDDIERVVIPYPPEKPQGYVFRILPNIETINKDPDRFFLGFSQEQLEFLIELFSYLYTNYEAGGVTDNTFDTLQFYLNKKYKAQNRKYEKVGAPPIPRLRTKLPFQMGSLDKIKPNTLEFSKYLEAIPEGKGLFVSEKLDGISALWYKGKLYTRGDGVTGGDITPLSKKIKGLEDVNDAIRGELVVKKSVFASKYSKNYSNPRNFVSSKVNSGVISDGVQDVEFLAYEIINSTLSPQKQFDNLQLFGFKTPYHKVLKRHLSFDIIDEYAERREKSEYAIDGLVLQVNSLNSKNTSIAFKMLLEEQIRETKVMNIEWNISRYGRYVPVLIYENVYIDGARLHRASAFNAHWVKERSIGQGTKIKIARSGDVIPYVTDVTVDASVNPIYPSLQYPWKWEGRDIVLVDVEGNKDVQIAKLVYLFETLNIPRLRDATVTKLWEAGKNTASKIVNCKPEDFKKVKGIGDKLAKDFYENIHNTLKNLRIERLFFAASIFEGLGKKLLRNLYKSYPMVLYDPPEKIEKKVKELKIDGFGPKRIQELLKSIGPFRDFINSLSPKEIDEAFKKDQERKRSCLTDKWYNRIKGKNVLFTGFLGDPPSDLEDFIYDHDGDVAAKVNDHTLCVIANNPANISEKMKEAKKRNIPVYTPFEFRKEMGVMVKDV